MGSKGVLHCLVEKSLALFFVIIFFVFFCVFFYIRYRTFGGANFFFP